MNLAFLVRTTVFSCLECRRRRGQEQAKDQNGSGQRSGLGEAGLFGNSTVTCLVKQDTAWGGKVTGPAGNQLGGKVNSQS